MAALGVPTAGAQGHPGTLTGLVINGTAGSEAPESLEMTLRFRDEAGQIVARQTIASGGAFAFSGVPPVSPSGYHLETIYQGAPYAAEVATPLPVRPIVFRVYETTRDTAVLALEEYTLVMARAEAAQRSLGVLAVVRLENRSDRTFLSAVGEAGPMDLLRFSLPPGAADLDVQTFLEGGHLVQVDRGFALTTPVPPGRHDILFTYRSPYRGRSWALDQGFPFGAAVFRLMVVEGLAGRANAPGLTELGPVAVGTVRYTLWEARGLARGGRLSLELMGLPQPSLWRRLQERLAGDAFQRGFAPAVAGAVLLGILGYAVFRSRLASPAPAGEEDGAVGPGDEERRRLVERIASLDDLYAHGGVDEAQYKASRGELKAWLRDLALADEAPSAPAEPR
jgi:hypothetical protein